jgi:hypothetical protein
VQDDRTRGTGASCRFPAAESVIRTDDGRHWRGESSRTLPKEQIMPISPDTPGYPHQHPSEPTMTVADWTEAVAVGMAVLIAIVIVAGILALLIIL